MSKKQQCEKKVISIAKPREFGWNLAELSAMIASATQQSTPLAGK